MILATESIRAALSSGAIHCDPAPVRVEGAHIDVTLGAHYWVFAPFHREPWLKRLWLRWRGELDLLDADPRDHFILRHADVAGRVVIPPRGFALIHTEEFIGGRVANIVPAMGTRSTFARWGGAVCTANAGWGDAGYHSRWTGEVLNPHRLPMVLRVGMRLGYVSFHGTDADAVLYEADTRYNATAQLWTPEAMLPRRGNW